IFPGAKNTTKKKSLAGYLFLNVCNRDALPMPSVSIKLTILSLASSDPIEKSPIRLLVTLKFNRSGDNGLFFSTTGAFFAGLATNFCVPELARRNPMALHGDT